MPYEFTSSRTSEWKADERHFIHSWKDSNHVTDNSSRKTYIFNVKIKRGGKAFWTSQGIGCLQVLLCFVTVKSRLITEEQLETGPLQ